MIRFLSFLSSPDLSFFTEQISPYKIPFEKPGKYNVIIKAVDKAGNIREAEAQIKEELGDRRVRVAAIGQAGENLVSIANIIHEERSASRTGMGGVMGSKNLKAVAIRGTKDVQLFDPDGFKRLAKEFQQRIAKSDKYEHFRKN